MDLLPKAYPVEILHFLTASAGFVANVVTLYLAYGDAVFIRRHRINSFKQFMARKNVTEETVRLMINGIFVAIGVVSIISAPPSGDTIPEVLTFQLAFTRIVLMGASLALTFKSVKDLTDRYKLQGMYRMRYVGREDVR